MQLISNIKSLPVYRGAFVVPDYVLSQVNTIKPIENYGLFLSKQIVTII